MLLIHIEKIQLIYLVVVKFASAGLKSKAHLCGLLHGGPGKLSFFLHDHPSKLCKALIGLGSVIHVNACVAVTK
jgi:hypothetical protein